MKITTAILAIALSIFSTLPLCATADDITVHPIHFSAGESSAQVKGSIKGYEIIDYTLKAQAGQLMAVNLKTSNASNYFNVITPNSEMALFIGSISGSDWTGELPEAGEYRVRVYLMRNAARRNEVADYTLNVKITGKNK